MVELLFTARGRINRAVYWKGVALMMAVLIPVAIAYFLLAQIVPRTPTPDGSFKVDGLAAIPFDILSFGYFAFLVFAGLCLAIKRYHDRDKSGWWTLIVFVPFIGEFWNFIETGCLPGTPGPNRFGPDPLARQPIATGMAAA